MGTEEHCKQISLACVGSARSVWATLGLPPFNACVLSWSTLLRLQVALKWNCLKWALGCGHFPGLSCSGSGSCVLQKEAQTQLGVHPVLFPVLSSSGDRVLGECTVPGGPCILITSPSWPLGVPGVPCVSSVELISGCNPPGSCQPSRISGRCG